MTTVKIKQAAEYLGLSEYSVRKLCREKQLPHIFAGGVYLFRIKSLDEWMDNQEKQNLMFNTSNSINGVYPISE